MTPDLRGDPSGEAARSGPEKSAEAFRTITEVSAALDIPQHVLRFWEGKFTQIRPLKRGGGRRYYRPEDVDLLRGICRLLYGDGYTIRGVQKILRESGVRYVVEQGRRAHGTVRRATEPPVRPEFEGSPPEQAPAAMATPARMADPRRIEAAARALGRLKALKREHELRLQAIVQRRSR